MKRRNFLAGVAADDARLAGDPEVRQRVPRLAAAAGIPVASSQQTFERDGALLALGTSIAVLAARAAGCVDKSLEGAPLSDLPIELPTVFSAIFTLKTAKALGLAMPQSLVLCAKGVIQ